MQYYYSNDISNDLITLDEVESKHCVKVMRYDIGKEINVVDGHGNLFISKITKKTKSSCELKVIRKIENFGKRENYLHIATSPLKSKDRMEWLIEKIVEIGVDEVSFVYCKHTEKRSINLKRLKKIAISAMKQSQKALLPKINEVILFKDFLSNCKNENKLLAHMNKGKLNKLVDLAPIEDTCIVIGPEGDFSSKEVDLAKEHDFKLVGLGKYRLRSETAAVVACTLLNNE